MNLYSNAKFLEKIELEIMNIKNYNNKKVST